MAAMKTMENIYQTVIDPNNPSNRETEACWMKLFAFVAGCRDSRLGLTTIMALKGGQNLAPFMFLVFLCSSLPWALGSLTGGHLKHNAA